MEHPTSFSLNTRSEFAHSIDVGHEFILALERLVTAWAHTAAI